MWEPRRLTPYERPRPVTGIALPFFTLEDSEFVLVFERNNADLRNCQVLSEQTSDSSAFLNVTSFKVRT
jgi:hypothetical protein